ncbi:hypothetical protein ACG93S_12720 [Streptomyces sp. WAC01490]|uniref:hypothetical protein n=1 Tax=unclassified Streptomyces TaxID=2593676 RepID=UPI003F2FA223
MGQPLIVTAGGDYSAEPVRQRVHLLGDIQHDTLQVDAGELQKLSKNLLVAAPPILRSPVSFPVEMRDIGRHVRRVFQHQVRQLVIRLFHHYALPVPLWPEEQVGDRAVDVSSEKRPDCDRQLLLAEAGAHQHTDLAREDGQCRLHTVLP